MILNNQNIKAVGEKFNQYPLPEHLNGLPDVKIGAAKELIGITKKAFLEDKDISDLWGVFKIQSLTGKKFYQTKDDVYSHFINWLKKQDFNEIVKRTTSKNGNPRQPLELC